MGLLLREFGYVKLSALFSSQMNGAGMQVFSNQAKAVLLNTILFNERFAEKRVYGIMPDTNFSIGFAILCIPSRGG